MDNKNLPAYPHTSWEDIGHGAAMFTPERLGGFSKREIIAAMCLQGMLANTNIIDVVTQSSCEWMAKAATDMSDALLTHLENTSK